MLCLVPHREELVGRGGGEKLIGRYTVHIMVTYNKVKQKTVHVV